MSKIIKVKLPKPVFLNKPADFSRLEEALKTLAEKFLSPDWEWTFKVGGKVQKEIENSDPDNEGLRIIAARKVDNLFFEENVKLMTPEKVGERGGEGEIKGKVESAQRVAPPPPRDPPQPFFSKGVAAAMGKREWQIEKLKEGEDTFFKINKNEFEERDLLPNRKEIWDWFVLCVQGEHKNLFCAHIVRECDKWDIQHLYREVKGFLNTENYREFGERIEKFFMAKPGHNEDIFTYISRLDKYEEEILHLDHLAQETGETLKMPKFYKVWKVLSAVEKYPDYRIFTEKVQLYKPTEWINLIQKI
jgi:hypothetical protein